MTLLSHIQHNHQIILIVYRNFKVSIRIWLLAVCVCVSELFSLPNLATIFVRIFLFRWTVGFVLLAMKAMLLQIMMEWMWGKENKIRSENITINKPFVLTSIHNSHVYMLLGSMNSTRAHTHTQCNSITIISWMYLLLIFFCFFRWVLSCRCISIFESNAKLMWNSHWIISVRNWRQIYVYSFITVIASSASLSSIDRYTRLITFILLRTANVLPFLTFNDDDKIFECTLPSANHYVRHEIRREKKPFREEKIHSGKMRKLIDSIEFAERMKEF